MKEKIKAGIIGGSGFTGIELIKILDGHKYVEIAFAASRTYKNLKVSKIFPSYKDKGNKKLSFIEKPTAEDLGKIDVMFLCLPPLESMEFLKNISGRNKFRIIDLGSDFRLKNPEDYKYWYGTEHILKNRLSGFVYGLTEVNKKKIKESSYIANPGCYPVSVLLGLAPILKNNVKIEDIYIDSKSGVSGAGRKLNKEYLFSNIDNNFYAYSTTGHRHTGEIEQEIENMAKKKIKVSFTPHLMPMERGIFTSIYCRMGKLTEEDAAGGKIFKIFENFYKEMPFVSFTGNKIPKLKDVLGTNMCMIGISQDIRTHTLKIFSVIDNLLKGAAGQAVQNMNIMLGFDEEEGLKFNGMF